MTAFADRMEGVTGSAIRELFKLLASTELISFGGGNPAKESFPIDAVREMTDRLLKDKGEVLLQYGGTEGYMPLREAVAQYLPGMSSLGVSPAEVLITSGSMQGLSLICQVFLNPGDTVLVESPTFLGTLQTFHINQANMVPVPSDDEGVVISELERLIIEHKPKVFYCIPTFQNPSGKTLGKERRRRIAELAAQYDFIVMEDDPYCDLRYNGEPLPNIKSFDTCGHVLLLKSFSKILSPGMRVGCVVAPAEIHRKLTIAKQSADTHTSNITQAVAAEFLTNGMLEPHIKSICADYALRLNTMTDAMAAYFPPFCKFIKPDGGLFIWCELPKHMKTMPIFDYSVKELKVAFIPGQHFFVRPELGDSTFRLNFSAENTGRITEGIKRLGSYLYTLE